MDSFKIKLENEEEARQWVQDYYNVTDTCTMVFQRSKNWVGLYLRCHHRQLTLERTIKADCLSVT